MPLVLATPTSLPSPSPTAAPTLQPRQSLQPVVDACAGKHKGMLRIVVKDLASGDTARLNDGSRFSFASLYKLFVMQAAADQAGQPRTP